MKEYWTDEDGVAHRILFDGKDYVVLDGDAMFYLDDEDVFDEAELEEMRYEERPLTEEELWEMECDRRYDQMRDKWIEEERYA